MRRLLIITSIFILTIGCKQEITNRSKKIEFNQGLADKLSAMNKIDQYYAGIPQGKHKGNWASWYVVRDSINRVHKKVLDSIIQEYNYPGYDLVGKKGESDFWVMVQHSDFDSDFQSKVLVLLKEQVDKKNADGGHFGLLTDRIRKNTNKPQLFGTQVSYNKYGQAFIAALEDSINVNKRRNELGMELLEEYLNGMTKIHFEMNKEGYQKAGILEPKLYKVPVIKK